MNGMNLTASDIILILNSCKKNSVNKLTMGDITIEFDTHNPTQQSKITSGKDARGNDRGEMLAQSNPDSLTTDGYVEMPFVDMTDNELINMDELEFLSISDPAQFEELTIKALRDNQG